MRSFVAAAACELAVTVKTDVADPFAGTASELGLKEQVTGDEVEHARLTFPEKPLSEVTPTLKFADPPADTVADVGLREAVKSAVTCI